MKVIYYLLALLLVQSVQAQWQQGRVVYEFTPPMHIAGGIGMAPRAPKPPVFKTEVLFGNNQMLSRRLEDDDANDVSSGDDRVVLFVAGNDDVTWINFSETRKVEQRELATKQYLVSDSIRKQSWKLTGESKTILGYACQQATTTRNGKHIAMTMENGSVTRKEVPDTSHVIVWFTPAIPVAAGPDFQGQLPGLVMEITINGNPAYKAIEVSPKADVASIKEPKSGKKVTAEEFTKERDKLFEEMQRNGGGGIRIRH